MIQNAIYPVECEHLKPYIKHYFVLDFSNLPTEEMEVKVPPTGFPVLQFHFGENSNFYRHKHYTDQSLFIGQCSKHITLQISKGLKLVGVNFKPYGLHNLLGISPSQILNSGIESHLFFGEDEVENIIQILKTKGIEEGISEIEKLLLSFQQSKVKIRPYFDEIVDKIENQNGLIDYLSLLGKNMQRRSFQRYFKEVIGISPKLFCQVLRHKYIMDLLYKNPKMTWSDIHLNGFYYDYTHFSKDFVLFSGVKPKQYLSLKNSFALAILFNE